MYTSDIPNNMKLLAKLMLDRIAFCTCKLLCMFSTCSYSDDIINFPVFIVQLLLAFWGEWEP